MIRFLLEFIFCSGLFVALYKLLVEGRVAHRWARRYLLVAMALAAIIPLLELPLYPAQTIYYEVPIILSDFEEAMPVGAVAAAEQPPIDWRSVLSTVAWTIYFIVLALNLMRFVWRLWIIRKLRHHAQITIYEAYTLAESERVSEPFTFWRTIFLGYDFTCSEREQVIVHEQSHVRHLHTAERLMLELMRCVFWFNPFVWLSASYLVEVQEWEADSDVLSRGYDVYEYRQLIFRQLFGYRADVTCGLNSQTSKKRFLMMTNFKKGKLSFLRLGATIPVVAAMILAFGSVRAEANVEPMPQITVPNPTPPDEKKGEVYISAEGKIFFNDKEMTFDELRSALEQFRAEQGPTAVLDIKADTAAKMAAIEDVKLAARQSKVLRIRYVTPEKEIDKILPPPEGDPNLPYDVEISADLKHKKVDFVNLRVAKNNLLMIVMNAAGKILTTRPDGKQALVDLAELKDIIKQFVDNSVSVNNSRKMKNPNYSSFTWQTIKRSDDGELHYPVSDGIISIQTTRDTSVDNYIALQATIQEAYAELREELSQRVFSKSFASLEGYDRDYVLQAIPMKVSEADPRLEKSTELQSKSSLKTLPKGEDVLRPRVESGDRIVEFLKDGYALDGRSVTFDELKSSFADLSSGMSLRIWGAKNSDRQLDISFLPDGHFSVQVFDNGSGKKNYVIGRVDNTIKMDRYKNQFDVRLTKLEAAPY